MRRIILSTVSIILVLLLSIMISFRPSLQLVNAQQQSTSSFSDNFSTDSGLWQYLGAANRNATNQDVVLTDTGYGEAGAVFFNNPIQGSFMATFSYKVGGGYNGDGFTMFFYKAKYSSLDNGGSLGFRARTGNSLAIVPGYGIEFDAWQNIAQDFQQVTGAQVTPPTGDPSSAHIALIQGYAGNHLVWVNDARVDDNNWHQASVEVGQSFVAVYIDQGLVLYWIGTLDTTYSGFGFSGATGGCGSNYHIIGNFSVTLGEVTPPNATPSPTYAPVPIPTPTIIYTSNPTSQPIPPVTIGTNQLTQPFSDDFSTNTGDWQYLGTAHRDSMNQYMVLTDNSNLEAGVAFFNHPIQGPFTASFSYKAGGGNCNGDGFTMFFYKQLYTNPANGGDLAFSPLNQIAPGYGIEFDGWQNIPQDFQSITDGQINPSTGDPSSAYIGLVKDSVGNHLTYVNDPRIDDNNWHQVTVNVGTSSISVYLDQVLVIQWTGTIDRTYNCFGFSAGNGECGDDWHIISHFSISAQNMQQPSLTISCKGAASQSGLNVQIKGDLTLNGTGISGAPILLSYSVTGGASWQDLTFLNTGSDGSYVALWFPTVTGNYLLKAVYQGNENSLGTENIVNFAMVPCSDQSIFSATSNSTLTELSFNPSSKELTFNVSGTSGTTGYVNLYIPKSLVSDISGLTISLNGNQIEFTTQSQSDCWLLYITYYHSEHTVMISLGSSNGVPEFPSLPVLLLLISSVSISLAILKSKNKQGLKQPLGNKFA